MSTSKAINYKYARSIPRVIYYWNTYTYFAFLTEFRLIGRNVPDLGNWTKLFWHIFACVFPIKILFVYCLKMNGMNHKYITYLRNCAMRCALIYFFIFLLPYEQINWHPEQQTPMKNLKQKLKNHFKSSTKLIYSLYEMRCERVFRFSCSLSFQVNIVFQSHAQLNHHRQLGFSQKRIEIECANT